jgi:predicted dehydrogenase
MTSAKKIRAAVIGCGDISALHLAAIDGMPDAELVAVCDVDPERLAAAMAQHGVAGYSDAGELFAQSRPDVVHICTPHNTHAELAVRALEAGVEVILEKPVAHTRDEAARLIEVAGRTSGRIGVCFQNRYNPPVAAMKALLRSGDLGRVMGASATVFWHRTADYYRARPWRGTWAGGGGGLLMNQAIHTVDLVQWLVGDVVRVDGGAGTRMLGHVIEVEDTADLVLTHENGAVSVLFATLSNAVNAPVTIDIETEHARLSLCNALTVTYADGRVDVVEEQAAASGERAYWGLSHELLIRDFYDGVGSGAEFWTHPAEAAKSLGIVQDLYDLAYPDRAPALLQG